jgi:lysophospholipase L1-like esterase
VLVAGVATAVALAGGELLIRALLPPLPHVEIREDPEAEARRQMEIAEGRVFQAEKDAIAGLYVYTPTGLRLRANTVAEVRSHHVSRKSVQVKTNSIGFRNREIGPKERARVLFLGDSITLAGYLDEPDTFVRRVEALSATGPVPYETINAGVGGIGIEDELALLTEIGLGTDPDIVILGFYMNDAIPSPGVRLIPPPTWLERSRIAAYLLLAVSHLRDRDLTTEGRDYDPPDLEAWLAQVTRDFPGQPGDALLERPAFNFAIERHFRDWGCVWSDGAWKRMLPVLKEFRRLADRHGFRLQIVSFPLRLQVEADHVADEPQRRLGEIASDLGVPYLDLLTVLRAARRTGGGDLFYDHCHPTPRGAEIVAEEILRFLWAQEPTAG